MTCNPSRRHFLGRGAAAAAVIAAPAISYAGSRPKITRGLQSVSATNMIAPVAVR